MKHKERDIYPEDFGKPVKMYKREKTPPKTFNILSIANFNQRWSEETLKDHLYKEFRRFGDYLIEFIREPPGEKKAIANFKYFEDAMAVRSAFKINSLNIDPNIIIEPYYDEPHKERRLENQVFTAPKSLRSDKNFSDDAEDKGATRTLFIGNLDFEIRAEELQRIFGQFGFIEDIDIKKYNGQLGGSVYAFIRFLNLEMARNAKFEMSGKYIGKFICRIGYGKHVPSNCLWVGNIGPNVSREDLEKCFSSFNPLKIHWSYGRQFAYIVFTSLEVASSVLASMQGFEIFPGNPLRLDFSDENHLSMFNPLGNFDKNPIKEPTPKKEAIKAVVNVFDSIPPPLKLSLSEATTVSNVVKQLNVVWKNYITLKSSIFHVSVYLLCGCPKLVEKFMDENTKSLPIQRKISTEHQSLTDLLTFVQKENSDCSLLLVVPDESPQEPPGALFKLLTSYLAKKQLAGLTTLPTSSPPNKLQATIHWFFQGSTFKQLLKLVCPKLTLEDVTKDNFVLGVLNTVKI